MNTESNDGADYYSDSGLSVLFHDFLAANDIWLRGDVDFYVRLADECGRNILDLGCGAGRIAFALAERGARVTAVDLSQAMLKVARERHAHLPKSVGDRVQLLQGDMTALDLGQTYDAVIIPYFAFNHMRDEQQRAAVLDVIGRHLRAGGRAAIHILPDEWFSELDPRQVDNNAMIPFDQAGRRLRVRPVERALDAARMTTVMEYAVYAPDGALLRRSRERLAYYRFNDEEFRRAAHNSGLSIVQSKCHFFTGGPLQSMYITKRRRRLRA